jgi:hypothetical protein
MGLQVWMQSLAESTTTNKLHDEGDVDVHRQREHGLLPTAVTVHIRQSDRRLSRDDDRLRAKCPRRRLLSGRARRGGDVVTTVAQQPADRARAARHGRSEKPLRRLRRALGGSGKPRCPHGRIGASMFLTCSFLFCTFT